MVFNFMVKVAYWISSNIAIAILNFSLLLPHLVIALPTLRSLVHYQILHLSNIAIAILDFSLLLSIKLSLFQLFDSKVVALNPFASIFV